MNGANRQSRILDAREAVKSGNFERAAGLAAILLADDPRDIEALEICALSASGTGDHSRAEEALRTAIEVASDRRWPYADLSRLLLALGRVSEAEDVARSALTVDANNADAHAMLGSILAKQDRWFDSAGHFERAILLAGSHPQLLTGLGQALLRLGRLEDARGPLEAAARGDPEGLEQAVFLAELEERLGHFEAATLELDRAGRIAAKRGTDVDLQRSVLLARKGEIAPALALLDSRSDLSGHALLQRGRLRDRIGRHAEAWSDWTTGKAMLARASGREYRAGDVEAETEALASFFTPAQIADVSPAELRSEDPQPIFILGFPRSGTTLAEQILASHSSIRAGGELPFGSEVHELAVSLAGGSGTFPEGLSKHADWPALVRDLYLARARRYGLLEGGARFFTDKMPLNDSWLPLLRLAFPASPVVLVRRHPLDVLVSVMSHDMTHGFNCAYRLEDAARHLALVDRLLETYRLNGIGPTHTLRYESLVAGQQVETEQLMRAIGLPMEEQQLRFHDRAQVAPTPSYAQVREPLNANSIGRWRNFEKELEPVRPVIAAAMAGYAD